MIQGILKCEHLMYLYLLLDIIHYYPFFFSMSPSLFSHSLSLYPLPSPLPSLPSLAFFISLSPLSLSLSSSLSLSLSLFSSSLFLLSLSLSVLSPFQCIERMYNECHLVHADLSEYNMLWFEGRVYLIDVSQSIEPSSPHGLELLLRDCKNVTTFFPSKGVSDVPTAYELFNRITGLDITAITDQEFVAQVSTCIHCIYSYL